MKKILIAFAVLSFFSCSNDNSEAVRSVTFRANGVYKKFDDIRVTSAVDNSFDVPFTILDILANPKDDRPEIFSLRVIRGGQYDGQSTNGGAFLNGTDYFYNFDNPIQLHLTINTTKRIKGTFEGFFKDINGENIQITDGRIDITYYQDNPDYIKR